jgi:hypothetical protein
MLPENANEDSVTWCTHLLGLSDGQHISVMLDEMTRTELIESDVLLTLQRGTTSKPATSLHIRECKSKADTPDATLSLQHTGMQSPRARGMTSITHMHHRDTTCKDTFGPTPTRTQSEPAHNRNQPSHTITKNNVHGSIQHPATQTKGSGSLSLGTQRTP